MLFHSVFQCPGTAAVQRFLRALEERGCESESRPDPVAGRAVYRLWLPGADRLLPRAPMAAPFLRAFWDEARLEHDGGTGETRFHWIYWTPGRILTHLLIAAILFAQAENGLDPVRFLALAVLANTLPALLALQESRRLTRLLRSCGFRKG